MGDMMNQMKAIWSYLDEMLEEDPEKYKAFIEEQMLEAKTQTPNKLAKTNKSPTGENSGSDGNVLNKLASFANLGLDRESSQPTNKIETPVARSTENIGEEKSGKIGTFSKEKVGLEDKTDELLDIVIPVSGAPTRPKYGNTARPLIEIIEDDTKEQ